MCPRCLFELDTNMEYAAKINRILKETPCANEGTIAELADYLEFSTMIIVYLVTLIPDGDAAGSCIALALALQTLGKRAFVVSAGRRAAYVRCV